MNNSIKSVNLLGFYSSVLLVLSTALTFIVAYLTPPLAGPFCKAANCFTYPFADIASRFPRDYYWMYLAILVSLIFIILMVSVHHYTLKERKIYSHIGLLFSSFGAFTLIADFFLQISIIQPSLLLGESDGISLLTQFNPHGVFIVLEELGYLSMAVAFLFLAFAFAGSGLEKLLRWTLVISFLLTVSAFVFFSVQYGLFREYRFEVAAISINWLTLLVSGTVLAILFWRARTIS
jgi:cytochrome c oxidase subunit IV